MTSQALSPAFSRCHPVTAKWEGGWVDDPIDPGGETNFGVTYRVYDEFRDSKGLPRRSVKQITKAEALELFYVDYWLRAKCNTLFAGVDLAVYDASVNSGVSRGRRWLLSSLAANDDHVQTVKNICGKRLSFVQALKIFWKYGRGWSRRIADIQATGVAWALAATTQQVQIPEVLQREVAPKRDAAKNNSRSAGGAGTVTGAGGVVATDPGQADLIAGWLLGGVLAAGLLLTAYFVWRAWVNKDQADAYERKAETLAMEIST